MPDIPYKPYASVQPTERATPYFGISFPRPDFTQSIGAALGELGKSRQVLGGATTQVGTALASLGKSFEGAGDEIWTRAHAIKQVQNQTAGIEADTKYLIEAGQMDNEFRKKTGHEASDGLQAHMQALDRKRQEIRNTLPNDEAKHYYDRNSLYTLGRTVFGASHYASQQGKAANIGALDANFKINLSALENRAETTSPEVWQEEKAALYNQQMKLAEMEGVKGPQLKARALETNSRLEAARISGYIKAGDTDRAKRDLDLLKSRNEILSSTAQQLDNSLEAKREDVAAKVEGTNATNYLLDKSRDPDLPPKPITDMVREAIANSPEDLRKRPGFQEKVERVVLNAVTMIRSADEKSRQDAYYYLTGQIYDDKGQLKPKWEAVIADPRAKAQFDFLRRTGPLSQEAAQKAYNRAVMAEEYVSPRVSAQSLTYIKGLTKQGGDAALRLMNMNLWDKDLKDENGNPLKMNVGDIKAAIRFRDEVKARPDGDPRVHQAWKWLESGRREEMSDLGLLGKSNKDDPDVIQAWGELSGALEAYEKTHAGKVADYKAVVEEIGKEMLRHKVGSWSPWQWAEPPQYRTPIPDEKVEEIRAEARRLKEPEPTMDEIRSSYWQLQWERHFRRETK